MAIGTAGYTAMLAVMALERHGLDARKRAGGGDGGCRRRRFGRRRACSPTLGYTVHAITGRPQEADYLKSLGAAEIIDRKELTGPVKPLAKERWAGGIDAVGSTTLANLLSMTRYGGAVAACGLAGGMDLPTTVAPFILRGVSPLRHRLGDVSHRASAGSLEPAGNRPRPRETGRHDPGNRPFGRSNGRSGAPRRKGSGTNRGQNRVNAFRIYRRNPCIIC